MIQHAKSKFVSNRILYAHTQNLNHAELKESPQSRELVTKEWDRKIIPRSAQIIWSQPRPTQSSQRAPWSTHGSNPTYDFPNHSCCDRASGCAPETWSLNCERRRESLCGILKTTFANPTCPTIGGALLDLVFCATYHTYHPPATPQANPRLEVVTSGGFRAQCLTHLPCFTSIFFGGWLVGACDANAAVPIQPGNVLAASFVRTCKFRFLIQTLWLQVSGVPTVTMRQHPS